MSRYDYELSKHLAAQGMPFYAVIMCAMRQADIENLAKLSHAFPMVWYELQERYNAPGGRLAGELDKGDDEHDCPGLYGSVAARDYHPAGSCDACSEPPDLEALKGGTS